MYVPLPRPPVPGLPCLALRIDGSPSRADAERFCRTLDHLPERQPVRLLVRFAPGADPDGWPTLRDALRRRVCVDRVAFVGDGAGRPEDEKIRCYGAAEESAAWAWVQGLVPPSPSWGSAEIPKPSRLAERPRVEEAAVAVAMETAGQHGDGAVRPLLPPVVLTQRAAATAQSASAEVGWGALVVSSSARARVSEEAGVAETAPLLIAFGTPGARVTRNG